MNYYDSPYIGMQFVSDSNVATFPTALLGLVEAMPQIDRQSKNIYIEWTTEGRPTHVPKVIESRLAKGRRADPAAPPLLPIDAEDLRDLRAWFTSQSTSVLTALRWLPVQDDGFRMCAWQVSGNSINKRVNNEPRTDMLAVCLAEPIVDAEPASQRRWVESILDAIERSGSVWRYGYMEIGDWHDIHGGRVYTTELGNPVRWRQLLEYSVWQCYGMLPRDYKIWQDNYPVKGVYWGNYFGPQILERIGGAERIKAHIDERCHEDPRNGWYRDMPGGALFLALSDRISDAKYTFGTSMIYHRAIENGVWLWSILREANVMI